MSGAAAGVLALLTVASLVLAWGGRGYLRPDEHAAAIAGLAVPGCLLAVAGVLGVQAPATGGLGAAGIATLAVAASAAGGGGVATSVLALADRPASAGQSTAPGVSDPDLLHGGAWVGVLERLAAAATLLAGWPEGLALVLAVKGLGRYPELRATAAAAAERFIIGTFASVLWAAACAGVGRSLL